MDIPQMYTFHEGVDNGHNIAFPFGNFNGNSSTNWNQFPPAGSTMGNYGTTTSGVSYPRSSTAGSHSIKNMLATANHHKLLGSGNQVYCALYELYVGLKTHYKVQKELLSELKGELTTLRRQVLEQPTKSRKEHPGSDCNSQNKPLTRNLDIPSTPPVRQRKDYPDVPFWTKVEWDALVEHKKLANKTPAWNAFLTDKEDAKLTFNSLYFRHVDPSSWSKKTDVATAYFYNTITAKDPEFQLCKGNWKIQTWATERYPDWAKNVRKPGGLKCAVPSIVTVGQKRPGPPLQHDTKSLKKPRPTSKRKSQHNTPPLRAPVTNTATQDPITIDNESDEESIYVPKRKATSSLESEDNAPPLSRTASPLCKPVCTDPMLTVAASGSSLSPSPLPQSTTLGAPTSRQQGHQVLTAEATVQSQVNPTPVLTDQLPTPPRLPSPPMVFVQLSNQPAPLTSSNSTKNPGPGVQQSMNPLYEDRADLVVPKAVIELPKTASPPQTSDAIVKSRPVKKKLVPLETLLTPCNFYMRDYLNEYPDASPDNFCRAWADLPKLHPAALRAYETRSKELKAAAKAAPSSLVIMQATAKDDFWY
ncbi:hypothetical protein B0H34DRAFT_808261 [Crassisporium funariophilum]|nr:hypothetical protein B0H34DRAFT_808261 [Crassisporium funariophilum]